MTGRVPARKPVLALLMRLLWATALVLPAFGAQAGVVFSSLYSFTGTNDGATPYAGLVQGSDGSFYGTTFAGGTNNAGTVFKITPTGALTSLYSFTGTNDGSYPQAALVQGSDGNFYGTTSTTVFQMTPAGVLKTLVSGLASQSALVQGSDGYLYGTTPSGGTNGGHGTVFKISTDGALTSLYSFTGGNDGLRPNGLVQGSDGSFYGTTYYGGATFPSGLGYGAVFKISTNGALTSLYAFGTNSFGNPGQGINPNTALVQGRNGYFYGTTSWFESNGILQRRGSVFVISTNGVYGNLYAFAEVAPTSGLFQGSDGNFYGTTGGLGATGTVFQMTPGGALTTLVSGIASSALVQGSDGSFYGTTPGDGTNNLGTVFRLTIEPQLTITFSGGNVILSWPTNATARTLQSTVYLGAAAGWVTVNLIQPPVISNGQFVVTVPNTTTGPQQYYRLSQ